MNDTRTQELTVCFLGGDESGDGGFVNVGAGDECLARETHQEVFATRASNSHLPNVREFVLVAAGRKEDRIHDDLRRRPNVPADVERQFGVCLLDVGNQLVEVFHRFLS